MIRSKFGQRTLGLVLVTLGGGLTYAQWLMAADTGVYKPSAVVLCPWFFVYGLAPLLFPLDMERLRIVYGIEKPHSFNHLSLPWKLFMLAAVVAAFGNLIAVMYTFGPSKDDWRLRLQPAAQAPQQQED